MSSTIYISRSSDGLTLLTPSEGDSTTAEQVRALVNVAVASSAPGVTRCPAGGYALYVLSGGPCIYVARVPASYPEKLAIIMLNELRGAFDSEWSPARVAAATAPDEAVGFTATARRIVDEFSDTRSETNMERLQHELDAVQRVLATNLQDIMRRGENLNTVADLAGDALAKSASWATNAGKLNAQARWREMMPLLVVVAILLLILLWKFVF